MQHHSSGTISGTKRPRSTSPNNPGHRPTTPLVISAGKPGAGVPRSTSLAQRLYYESTRIEALNDLLRITVSHEINYSLDGDELLQALASVFYEILGWDPQNDKQQDEESDVEEVKFLVKDAWTRHLVPETSRWAEFCRAHLTKSKLSVEDLKCLEVILTILRNLSFVSANVRLMVYSNDVMDILVGSLYEQSSKLVGGLDDNNNNATVLAWNALGILMNLAPHMDVTGQKLVCDKLFLKSASASSPSDDGVKLPDPSTFGQAADGSWGFGSVWLAKKLDTKEDIVQDLPHDLLLQLTQDHLVRLWSIFPALAKVLLDITAPRSVTMLALELLEEFISQARVGVVGKVEDQENLDDIPNLRAILVYIPDILLQRLTDFLYIPRLGNDALEYNDPVVNIVTRVNPLKLLSGYDATIDTDIRDRALEVLVPLVELDSPGMAKRLGTKPSDGRINSRIFDALVPILSAQSGRNEAPVQAAQLLRELVKAKENRNGLTYIQERILAIASSDPRVAHLAFNHLYTKDMQ